MMRLLLYGSLTTMLIVGIYMAQTGNIPHFEKCKESIFAQVMTGECTLRDNYQHRIRSIGDEGENI